MQRLQALTIGCPCIATLVSQTAHSPYSIYASTITFGNSSLCFHVSSLKSQLCCKYMQIPNASFHCVNQPRNHNPKAWFQSMTQPWNQNSKAWFQSMTQPWNQNSKAWFQSITQLWNQNPKAWLQSITQLRNQNHKAWFYSSNQPETKIRQVVTVSRSSTQKYQVTLASTNS